MATATNSSQTDTRSVSAQRFYLSSARFDWIFVLLSTWVVGGLYLDGWAHRHGRVDTTFFTP